MGRVIFHIDMNCFFASCEIAENPSLKGKKVVVARDTIDKRGMVLAASYEAKALGIYTTQPLYDAIRKVKDLVIVNPRHELYEEYSERFFDYFFKVTPLVEPGSIDEAYLDVTDCVEDNKYYELAQEMQNDILELFNLPCSIGIAPNKFLAKMASDMKKPLGITILRKRDIEEKLWPLPMKDMFGAGKKTCQLLETIGIKTIGDLIHYPDYKDLETLLGPSQAQYLIYHANGNGSTVIDPNRFLDSSSISNAHTYDYDEYNQEHIKSLIKYLCNNVQLRMQNKGYLAQSFRLNIRFNNFNNVSKSVTITKPTSSAIEMYNYYLGLYDELSDPTIGVRLVSVAATKFSKAEEGNVQLSIFDELDKENQELEVKNLINSINSSIGKELLIKGIKK